MSRRGEPSPRSWREDVGGGEEEDTFKAIGKRIARFEQAVQLARRFVELKRFVPWQNGYGTANRNRTTVVQAVLVPDSPRRARAARPLAGVGVELLAAGMALAASPSPGGDGVAWRASPGARSPGRRRGYA
ncbi:hypothetical protein NL676_025664 [Syzygium grande]|nr:hypothetical protein NL676_025664 [Syzygium grande]